MAMLEIDYLNREDLQKAFDRARAEGKSHLLVLTANCDDVMVIRESQYTRSVDKPEDILDILREANKNSFFGTDVTLNRVYDVNQDFDLQLSFSDAAVPIAPASHFIPKKTADELRDEITKYYQERNYNWDMQAWDAQSWFKKLFIAKPEIPEFMAEAQPAPTH